jgi:hypothetical protein
MGGVERLRFGQWYRHDTSPCPSTNWISSLAEFWAAPLSGYDLPFMANAQFGYVMSALVGIGTIILVFVFVGIISERLRKRNSAT